MTFDSGLVVVSGPEGFSGSSSLASSGRRRFFPGEAFERSSADKPHYGKWPTAPVPGIEALFRPDGMSSGAFSRQVSRLMGRPVLVMNLDELPHHDVRCVFTPQQKIERARAIKEMAWRELPASLWRNWQWHTTARMTNTPNINGMLTKGRMPNATHPLLSPRLEGECWKRGAVIYTPHRNCTTEQLWRERAGLDDPGHNPRWPDRLEHCPDGDGIRHYIFLHEISHLLQLEEEFEQNLKHPYGWLTEWDGDLGAMEIMAEMASRPQTHSRLAHELEEAIEGVKHLRALQSFLKYPPFYCFPLALDAHIRGDPAARCAWQKNYEEYYDKSWLAADEIRLRTFLRLEDIDFSTDSRTLQEVLLDWRTGRPIDRNLFKLINPVFGSGTFDWAGYDPAVTLPVLRDIVEAREINFATTQRNAEMTLDAAHCFCPSLLRDHAPNQALRRPDILPDVQRHFALA